MKNFRVLSVPLPVPLSAQRGVRGEV